MPIRKKRPSASDVLRQEMQQPLVIPARSPDPEPNPTPTPNTNIDMTPTQDDAATAAQLKKVQESEAKLQQQIEDLNSKLKAQADTIVKLAEQSQAPAKGKSAALVKKDTSRSNASITARPTESREETARRRANTDIGWLD
ncbi:hypothetical protein [Chamaesiphon sp. OTE_8_metabat_110]|uniref:hypothetical protein n=1 Tax=Chamaesiphon sp. OTE_8_metabat_110 TaxID=2964696 RepID=UPI00286AD73C|nr:hypothetical protein [Chamaesiphon sp. OTE_8_metabat_110]